MTELLEQIRRLHPLLGTWTGRGRGHFPTIDAFAYEEELRFDGNGCEPLLHFEQRTWKDGSARQEPLHWESGFILAHEGGRFEMSNSQNGGRVEVLSGELSEGAEGLELVLRSTVLANDARLRETARVFTLRDGVLRYRVDMATQRTPLLQNHLEAELRRA